MERIEFINLGRKDYHWAWNYQKDLLKKRIDGDIGDTVLFLEHHPVYTIGKTGDESNILSNYENGSIADAPVVHIDRGGDITFHGPGQLVGYPILYLGNYYFDLHRYLRDVEEVLILTLKEFTIDGKRSEGLTGVWVGEEKIASIGVKVSRWCTMHGFALNVNNDLAFFNNIIACGIEGKKATSMEQITGRGLTLESVIEVVKKKIKEVFVPVK